MEKRNRTREKVINYMLSHPVTSKSELAKELGLSMPTVLSNVNDLLEKGIAVELGEYESTGGRKAKSLGINRKYARAVGVLITGNHLEMVMVNLGYEVEQSKRIRLSFSPEMEYLMTVADEVKQFIQSCDLEKPPLGIGIAIPGIVDTKERCVIKSHALHLENYSLRILEQLLELPVYFDNDANAAMLAEDLQKNRNALYLSLNHTLGGAFCMNGKLYRGENQKAGEFGHMILVPNGKRCYCGKKGCSDAYCAASVLTAEKESLECFMERVQKKEQKATETWEAYMEHLAILISNLRMAYDMDIILGGDVGGVLKDHMLSLGQKVLGYNGFDRDLSYIRTCTCEKGASAVGGAKYFLMKISEL